MSDVVQERFDQGLHLARSLPSQIVDRGVLQYVFVAPVLPMQRHTPADAAEAWRRLACEIGAGRVPELLSLYLHLPFCTHRCRYCVYYSVEPSSPGDVEAYLSRLHAELDFYGAVLRDVAFTTCYIGGGTPTALDEAQLSSLLTHLDGAVHRKGGGEWGFECNPLTATPAKAKIFKDHGFNRVSFGVQTLNESVLGGVNRGYQSRRRVAETLKLMQDHGFWINVDLIRGLPGESEASTLSSLEALLQLRPTQVTVYMINPETPLEIDVDHLGSVEDSLDAVRRVAEPLQYEVKGGTTVYSMYDTRRGAGNLLDREDQTHERTARYDDTTIEPVSLLGIGPTARSYIYGQMRYAYERYPVTTPFRAEARCITGRAVGLDEERRRFVVYRLEGAEGLRLADFSDRFGQDLRHAFRDEARFAQEQGLLEQQGDVITHATSDPTRRFATELLFVAQPTFDAAFAASRSGGSRGDSNRGLPIVIKARGRELEIRIADYYPDHEYYHHSGSFGFFVSAECLGGITSLRPFHDSMLAAFSQRFDRAIQEHSPRDLRELGRILQLSTSPTKTS